MDARTTFGSSVKLEKNLIPRSDGFVVVRTIYSLEDLPERCPVIPEQDEFPFEVRHLMYHSHRIVFRVEREASRVVIYRIFHGARQALGREDLL